MKRATLLLATAALALTSTVAAAQPYGGRNDRYGDPRFDNRGRNDNWRNQQSWQRGQRLDQRYRARDRVFNDWGRYRMAAPPRGYSYYRTDTGDVVLAAIATGVIASVIGGLLSGDNGGGYTQPYAQPYARPSYVQPGYSQPYYGQQPGYGGGQIFRDPSGRAYTVDQYGRSVWVQ
jgi:Ni/Co efflux regulator RcnB